MMQSPRYSRTISFLQACIVLLALTIGASADYTPAPEYERADQLIRASRYVKARELAEEMLKANPRSFEAQSILGRVHLFGEGNPGKAEYYLLKAHAAIVREYPKPGLKGAPWKCYAETLWSLRLASMDLEHYETAIAWLDEYNETFKARPHLYGWPLMKMGRLDEARKKMADARESVKDNPGAVNTILNTLGSIEFEAGNLEESLNHFEEIVNRVENGLGEIDAVFYSNAAEAARDLLNFALVEEYALEATQYLAPQSFSAPWLDLAELYTAQGRQPEAIEALKHHSQHLARSTASVQNKKRAESQRSLAIALLACGYDMEATNLLRSVAMHGDRNSSTSSKKSLIRSTNHFFYREALKQKRERLREQRSYSPYSEWPGIWSQELLIGREMEATRRECASLALKNGGPASMVAPYGANSFNCPWLAPAIGEIFGAGVVTVAAKRQMEALPEKSKPYAKAIWAELVGDTQALEECLDEIPVTQVLARGRLQAVLAQQSGSPTRLQQALEADPPVIRRLGLSIPVKVECPDANLKGLIKLSPRFHSGNGFTLRVTGSPQQGLSAKLLGPDSSVLSVLQSKPGEDVQESRKEFCRQLHQSVFAPRVSLTQSDINGLDGSNLAGSHFRNELKEILGTTGAASN